MAELFPYSAQFDFGRLFTDTGRVFARAWLPIMIGLLVFGIAPVALGALPWWRAPLDTTADAFRRIWTVVNLAKALVTVIAFSAVTVYVVAVSMTVLTGATWREMFQAGRVAAGFVTLLCVNLLGNWPTFVAIAAAALAPSHQVLWSLVIAGQLSVILLAAYIGIAATAAFGEQLLVGAAFARSIRLLRTLRWRMVGLGLSYLLLQDIVQYSVEFVLSAASISYRSPGLGRAVLSIAPLPLNAVATAVFVSFFLQARQIADGPTANELHEVFA